MNPLMTTVLAATVALACVATQAAQDGKQDENRKDVPAVLNFKMTDIDGKEVDLAKYKGKTILIVNVASKCGYTRQYAGLQDLYKTYKDKDFVILGFPCNQFGGQEPGTEADIKEFCSENYGVEFPLFAKVDVNGDDATPLYKMLTNKEKTEVSEGAIKWNFEKFLVDKNGNVLKHYRSKAAPKDIALDVEKAMKGEAITTE